MEDDQPRPTAMPADAPRWRSRRETPPERRSPVSHVTVRLARPTDQRADRGIVLTEHGGGSYSGEAGDVVAGVWDLEIEADRGARRMFRSKNRVTLD